MGVKEHESSHGISGLLCFLSYVHRQLQNNNASDTDREILKKIEFGDSCGK